MTEDDDESLVELARRGDGRAFARLLDRHYDTIYRVAFKWCGEQMDAEDVAQDVCIKLGRAIHQFDGRSAFSSWLYRVTLNTVRDFQRAKMRNARKAEAFALASEAAFVPDFERSMTISQLWQRILGLPDKQRDAVLLVYGEGLNHKYAGEVMGCSESTVSWHVHEAKKALKNFAEGSDDG